jgi:hypothetical protein
MQSYDFEILKGDETILVERSIWLRDTGAAWPRIAKLAKSTASPGCLIRVRDRAGATVILVGAASARRYFDPVAK